jgi:hypothetical protein
VERVKTFSAEGSLGLDPQYDQWIREEEPAEIIDRQFFIQNGSYQTPQGPVIREVFGLAVFYEPNPAREAEREAKAKESIEKLFCR